MTSRLNFEAEPFGEFGFNESEEEFEAPRVRDRRSGGAGAPAGRGFVPQRSGGRMPMRSRFGGFVPRRAFGFRSGLGFRPRSSFGRFGRGFGFGGGLGFGRRSGFRPGFGRFGLRRRWPWFRGRFGSGRFGDFGGTFGMAGGPGGSSQWIAWAQSCLGQLLGDWVPQDGTMGFQTRRAIQMFQTQQQLPPTGTLDENTVSALQAACSGQSGDEGGEGGGE